MPPGRIPKDPSKRVNRHALKYPWTTLRGAPIPAPKLPPGTWSRATRRWWKTWCEGAPAKKFLATDWARLQMVALLVEDYHRVKEPVERKRLLAEIRQNEAELRRVSP